MIEVLRQYMATGSVGASDISAAVERMVGDGTLRHGDRLPPIRTLADAFGIAPNTVAAAYRTLAERGYVEGQGRRGSFLVDPSALPPPEPPVPAGLVDLASGGPDPRLLPSLGPFLSSIDSSHASYGEPHVDPDLETGAQRLLEPDGVWGTFAVVNGALDGVERALAARLRPGDGVAVETPGWEPLAALVAAMGMRPIAVPVDDRGMLPDRLASVAGSVRAVLLTARCHNPTGAAVDDERAAHLRSVLEPRPDVLTVEDDHGGLIAGQPLAPVGAGRRRWVYTQSVSKSLGPDLRVALVTGDDGTVNRIVARQALGPGWVSHLSQRLVAAMLTDRSVGRQLAQASEVYAHRRHVLIEALETVGVAATGRTGLNVWAEVAEEGPVVAALAGAGFATRDSERFGRGAGPAIRLSVGNLDDDMVEPIVEAIGSVTASRRRLGRTR